MRTRDPQAPARLRRDHRAGAPRGRSSAATSLAPPADALPVGGHAVPSCKAEFSTAQAVTPGQGQTVRVSGVRVGDITKVDLKDGHAVVTMDLDPEYKDLVHTDATRAAAAQDRAQGHVHRARPGHRPRAAGQARAGPLPVSNTLPDVNPDEILAVARLRHARLPARCCRRRRRRASKGRGDDLREVFRRFEPTHRDLARVNGAGRPAPPQPAAGSSTRSDELNDRAGRQGATSSPRSSTPPRRCSARSPPSSRTSRRAVGDLPGALRQTTDTLGKVAALRRRRCARRPCTCSPPLKALDRANAQVQPFAEEATPIVREPDPARSCATRARSCARLTGAGDRARGVDARPDEHVHVAQPLLQPRELQPETGREDPSRPAATRATCSGSPGCSTTAPRCSRARTPTARSARSRSAGRAPSCAS